MDAKDTILPSSVAIYPHLLAFDLAFKKQLDKIPLERLLVYLIDLVPASAIPLLAKQFDVLGYKGMILAQTEADQRTLLKNALKLHKYVGTPYAIEEALKSIGFPDIEIHEGVNGHWARFNVTITNSNTQITPQGYADIVAMIKEYKNARSQMDGILINIVAEDDLTFISEEADVVDEIGADDVLTIFVKLFYNGDADYDGAYTHSADSDEADLI